MPVNITIRGVPDEVRDTLAARAARERKSMQEYLRQQLEKLAEKPTIEEWLERVEARLAVSGTELDPQEVVDVVREDRER